MNFGNSHEALGIGTLIDGPCGGAISVRGFEGRAVDELSSFNVGPSYVQCDTLLGELPLFSSGMLRSDLWTLRQVGPQ